MEIKHKLWLEKDGRVIFGPGRFELLEAVEECQSLSAAAKKLKMSYRAAWGRLRASEDRLGIPLVELTDNRQGMHLHAPDGGSEKNEGRFCRTREKNKRAAAGVSGQAAVKKRWK